MWPFPAPWACERSDEPRREPSMSQRYLLAEPNSISTVLVGWSEVCAVTSSSSVPRSETRRECVQSFVPVCGDDRMRTIRCI